VAVGGDEDISRCGVLQGGVGVEVREEGVRGDVAGGEDDGVYILQGLARGEKDGARDGAALEGKRGGGRDAEFGDGADTDGAFRHEVHGRVVEAATHALVDLAGDAGELAADV